MSCRLSQAFRTSTLNSLGTLQVGRPKCMIWSDLSSGYGRAAAVAAQFEALRGSTLMLIRGLHSQILVHSHVLVRHENRATLSPELVSSKLFRRVSFCVEHSHTKKDLWPKPPCSTSARMAFLEELPGSKRAELAADAVVWASQHGLVYGAGIQGSPAALVHAPLSVLPVSYPRASYEKARAAMPVFNLLIDRISRDSGYLQRTLGPAAEFDDFTASLLRIHNETLDLRKSRASHQLSLGIHRSDYMLDEPSNTLLQVELNTIASSFGCLSTLMTQLHHYTLQRADRSDQVQHLPPNQVTKHITDAMAAAVRAFGVPGAVMVMVVQPNDSNSYDQQWLQTVLWERHHIRTLRCTLTQIANEAQLDESSGQLTIWSHAVAVVYLRAGYAPEHYPTDVEWNARKMLEQSTAALCPSVAYQLTGAKKIQQDLAAGDTLERFLSADEADLMRRCFAGLWSLDDLEDSETKRVLSEVRDHPDRFVLKPQREGGGNNLYGKAILDRLQDTRGLAAFILMQRIQPPIHKCLMVRNGEQFEVESLSELGIFGTFLSRGNEVLINQEAGHLVRTKAATSDEGGVAAGFAVLDSPFLQD